MSAIGPTPDEIEAFVAGELDDATAERVRVAAARDPRVADEIEDCLQLRAVLGDADEVDRPVAVFAPRRRRRAVAVAAFALAAAAAVVIVWWATRRHAGPHRDPADAVATAVRTALSDHRGFEPRLSWAPADGYRPYDVARAAGADTAEPLPFELLARVEALRDPAALFAMQLVVGNVDQAGRVLDQAPTGAGIASDRAALALVRGDPERAIVHASAALALAPDHVQARWNRALALERLGLDRSAATELDAIAARGEPGWSDEARARAAALRARRARDDAASAAADRAGADLVAGGAPPLELIAAFPDRMRLYFYDAVRTAATAERLAALRPMATALDAQFGETTLAALLDRVAASELARRAPVTERYAAVLASRDPQAAADLVTAALAAGAADVALGALLYTGDHPGVIAPSQLDRYRAAAEHGADPWFQLAAIEQRATLRFQVEDATGAEAILADGLAACRGSRLVLRCQRIQRLMVHAYIVLQRFGAAHQLLDEVMQSARATTSIPLERDLQWYAGEIAARRDDVTESWQPVADAYLAEWALADGTCTADRTVRETRAMALINLHDDAAARAVFAGEPACPAAAPTTNRAFVLAHLTAGDPQLLAAVRDELAALRGQPALTAGERVFLDHVEGRALLDSDPATARVLLRRAADTTERSAPALRARSYSYAALIDDGAARTAWSETADLFAQELGAAHLEPCTLGISVDREADYVAMGRDGATTGARATAGGPGPAPVPAAIQTALDGCDHVTVVARGPAHGQPALLPADRAWSYRVRLPDAAAAGAGDRTGPTLIVSGAEPPARLQLPALAAVVVPADAHVVEGAAATPDHVLAAMLDASYIELHAHGVLAAEGSDAAFVALSPDSAGRYALTADAVAAVALHRHPVVVLASCYGAIAGTTQDVAGGLPDAFIAAGARAVIASTQPIDDADASAFFAALRERLAGGQAPSEALRDLRTTWTDARARTWIGALVVFER